MNKRYLKQFHLLKVIASFTALLLAGWSSDAKAATQYWNTSGTAGTWNTAVFGTSAGGPFNGAWVTQSDAYFGANSTGTFANATAGNYEIGNVTVADNATVNMTAGGSVRNSAATSYISTYNIGTGATLNWTTQPIYNTGVYAASGFVKNGAGTWNIGAQGNTYTGGFTLNAGTIIISGASSVGTGTFTINGGKIDASSSSTRVANTVIGGNFEYAGTGTQTWTGTVSLGDATRTITTTKTSGKLIYSGVISGAGGGLTIAGAGSAETFIGNTNNTFSGAVTIVNGKTVWNGSGAFGNTTSITLDEKVTLASNDAGTVGVTSIFAANKSIFLNTNAGIGIAGTGVTTINGVIADKLGAVGKLTKSDTGTLILGGASTYTGMTVVNNGTLKLADGNDRLPAGSLVKLGASGSSTVAGTTATFDLDGRSQAINGLESTTSTVDQTTKNTVTSASAATLTIGASSGATTTFGSGTVKNRGEITGALAVTKTGGGTQVLGGSNSYTGTTSINAGTLAVTGSLLSSGTVLVNDGGSLSGSGSVGAVTLASGSFLKPGNSPGTLRADSSIWQAGSTYSWEIDNATGAAGTNWDLFSVTGALDMRALSSSSASTKMNLVLNSLSLANFSTSTEYTWVIAKAGSFTGYADDNTNLTGLFSIDTANFNGGLPANLPTGGFQVVTGTEGSLRTLKLMAIPEPSTGTLLGFGLGGLVLTWLLRRKQS
jgi:autotransporter-associated beta strand protein